MEDKYWFVDWMEEMGAPEGSVFMPGSVAVVDVAQFRFDEDKGRFVAIVNGVGE